MAEERRAPGRVPAIILAVLVHLAFIAVLVFGVDWQNREAAPVVAELWNSLPGTAQPVPPPPKPEPAPEPPKPEPKPEPPKPEPKPEPAKPSKAEIELKAKEEKKKEEKRKEEELKKEAERKETEKKKQEDQRREELRKQLLVQERELQQQQLKAAAEGIQARQQAAAARSSLLNDYRGRIVAKIKPLIVNQPCAPLNNPEVEFEVRLMPTGMLLADPRLKKSSGSAQCDQAIERAVMRAQPLPLPPEPSLFGDFRELNLKFRPNE